MVDYYSRFYGIAKADLAFGFLLNIECFFAKPYCIALNLFVTSSLTYLLWKSVIEVLKFYEEPITFLLINRSSLTGF